VDEIGHLPLVGRDHEVEIFEEALSELPSRGATMVIRGEPGLGKTRLVEEVLRRSQSLGYGSAVGSSFELEQQRPFGALIDAFAGEEASDARSLLTLLTGPGPEASPEPLDLTYRVVEECLGYLESRLNEGPFVLALEDLHWADTSTLVFIRHAASRMMIRSLLLLCTRRPWPRSPQVDRIEEMRGVKSLALAPLSDDEVLYLARDRINGPLQVTFMERLRAAAGNPLFVQEVLAASAEESPTVDFVRSVVARLTYLSDDCLELLRVAAVLGTRFSFRHLMIAARRKSAELAPIVDEAVHSGLLHEDRERLRFRHELVRDAIYEDIVVGVRQEMHLNIAKELVRAGAEAGVAAPHFSLGAEPGDALAVEWIWRAARDSAPRSPGAAVDLLTHALELSSDGFERRDLLVADLVSALLWSGQFYRAELRAQQLLDRSSAPEARSAVRYAFARVLVYRGRVSDSLRQAEAALHEEGLSEESRARFLADVALRALVVGDVARSKSAADEATAIAERLGDTSLLALALCASSRVADHRGYVEEAMECGRRAASLAVARPSDAVQFVQPALYFGLALISGDRFGQAMDVLERGRRDAEAVGAAWSLPLFHLALTLARFHAGSWDDALVEAQAGLALSEETETQVWAPWTRALIARIHFHRDDLKTVEKELALARTQEQQAGCRQFGGHLISWSEALLLEARGRYEDAGAALAREWERWPPSEPVGDHRESAVDMTRLALAVGDGTLADEVIAAVELAASRWPSLSSKALVLACRGRIDSDADSLEQAARLFRSRGRTLETAQTLEVAGVQTTKRDPHLLQEALELYESLGATRDAGRVEAELRARGVRRGRRGPRSRPLHGWDSLTATEVKVVSLVAEGLTNRQIAERLFISHRTVDTHVSHALAKLGASARAELAAEAARRLH
jgi:DNA-binding CsgD family transcriptional regulator